jgi:5'/3'-nucleotidase
VLRVLLTNDDGIDADGLQALRRALAALDDVELAVIAPDGNRSATARSITFRRPLWVTEIPFADGASGYACDGTPVDCVRLATLGLVDGFEPDVIVSGINHGSNLGDDIAYSGTVAAALEGVVLGIPAIAVSQQPRELSFDFTAAAAFTARMVERLDDVPLPAGTLLNVNFPGTDEVAGVDVCRLGKRVYQDRLNLVDEDSGRRQFRIYGDSPVHDDEAGTDLCAVHHGRIAVTPLHFDLTAEHGMDALRAYDLDSLLAPAAREVE